MSAALAKLPHRIAMALVLAGAAALLPRGGLRGAEESQRRDLTVTFIDVGQGDSILLQCPNGQNILVDGGKKKAGKKVVACLRDRGARKIDLLIATHADTDHIGGLPAVIEAFPVDLFIDPGRTHTTHRYAELLSLVDTNGITYEPGRAGDVHNFGNVSMQILNPAGDLEMDNNNCSVVARVTLGKVSVLLTGDAEGQAEEEIIKRGHELKSQVLKAGHHGSRNSSSYVFVEKVRPEAVIFSCGEDNQYGHPAPEAIRAADHFGAQIYRTDESGDIVMETDGRNYSIWTEKEWKKYLKTVGSGMRPYPVDVNSASVEELARIPLLDGPKAAAIVRYRELVGPFDEAGDIAVIPGIGPSILEKIGHCLTAGQREGAPEKSVGTVPFP